MQSATSKITSPSGFLHWWTETLPLSGSIVCMEERLTQTNARTLIFRLLCWQDRSAILNGARQVYPVRYTSNGATSAPTASTLLFFPDYSPATTARRKSFSSAIKEAKDMNLEPFLISPAQIKLQYKGEKKMFDSPEAAEDFINSLLEGNLVDMKE